MTDIVHRVREYIQNPNRTTSMNKYWPRQEPLPPPASIELVEAAEIQLGFRLPHLLRDFYTQIGNGYFGPGYGFFQITDPPQHWSHPNGSDLVGINDEFQVTGRLFICDWGCDHYSYIDYTEANTPVGFYVGPGDEYIVHNRAFAMWIEDWLAGVDLWKQVMGTLQKE
jgi:hypothetical protein